MKHNRLVIITWVLFLTCTMLGGCKFWENIKTEYTPRNMLIGAGIGVVIAFFSGCTGGNKPSK